MPDAVGFTIVDSTERGDLLSSGLLMLPAPQTVLKSNIYMIVQFECGHMERRFFCWTDLPALRYFQYMSYDTSTRRTGSPYFTSRYATAETPG